MGCSLSTSSPQKTERPRPWGLLVAGALGLAIASPHPAAAAEAAGDKAAHTPQAQSVVPDDQSGNRSGVIPPPPAVDPDMTKPAPNPKAFPTPVIPPPGSPGSNSQVVPK